MWNDKQPHREYYGKIWQLIKSGKFSEINSEQVLAVITTIGFYSAVVVWIIYMF